MSNSLINTNPSQIKVGVGVLIVENGKTLLTQRIGKLGGGTYGSLGGHVEFGESLIGLAARSLGRIRYNPQRY